MEDAKHPISDENVKRLAARYLSRQLQDDEYIRRLGTTREAFAANHEALERDMAESRVAVAQGSVMASR